MGAAKGGGTPTCVSWLLLASYAVLLSIGGLGLWMSAINFGYEEALPPTPPPKNATITTTTTTTTTPPPRWFSHSRDRDNRVKVPQAYKDYVVQSIGFARICSDLRFYLAPLCLICVVVGIFTSVGGLFSRQLFSSTFSLYSSLGIWILCLALTSLYQSELAWEEFPFDLHMGGWVLVFHILLLLFLPVQMLLCIWEIWRQKTTKWPIINFLSVFTIEGVLLASRLALIFCTFEAFCISQVFRGFQGKLDPMYENSYYEVPRVRYPLGFSFLCLFAVFYSAVATLETTLSMLLGKLHQQMTTLTCELSGVCCVTVAILSSPAFVRTFIGNYTIYPETMNFAICLSVVTVSHWLVCCCFSSTMRTPLDFQAIDKWIQSNCFLDTSAIIRKQEMKGIDLSPKNRSVDLQIKKVSLIFSTISMAVVLVSLVYSPVFGKWGIILVLLGNAVTMMRTLPPLVIKALGKQKETTTTKQNFQDLSWLAFEVPCLLAGSIGMCTSSTRLGIFAGVSNILFAAFQGVVMMCLLKEKLSQDLQSADTNTKHLPLAEEVTIQDDKVIDAMA